KSTLLLRRDDAPTIIRGSADGWNSPGSLLEASGTGRRSGFPASASAGCAACRCWDARQRRTTEWALRPFFFPNFLEMDTRSGGFLMKEDELNALLAPLIRDLGLELVGIEFVPG